MILFKTVLGIISTVFFYILQFYINVELYQNYFSTVKIIFYWFVFYFLFNNNNNTVVITK